MGRWEVGDRVVQKGSTDPVGEVEDVHGDFVTVYWGTADRKSFRDEFRYDQLEKSPHLTLSPDEVEKRQAAEKGGKLLEDDAQELHAL